MVMIRMVGYYKIAAGVSSVWVSSWGMICKRVCLVMFLKDVGGDEPSPGLSLYAGLWPALARQGRALQGHCDVVGHAGRSQACAAEGEAMVLRCCHSSERNWVILARGAVGVGQEGGCPGAGLAGCGVKANAPAAATPWSYGVMQEVGSKQQRCRMQHAGGRGHPHAWMLGPMQGSSSPTARLGVLLQNSFSHAKTIWQIEPKLGLA